MSKYYPAAGAFIGIIIFSLSFSFIPEAVGQKQLVLLKKQKVILRLYFGDEIVYRTKGSKAVVSSYVNNLFDTAVMVHKTIVPFHQIDRLYFKQSSYLNIIGTLLVAGGVGYFVIDQVNTMIVKGEKPSLDEKVTTASVAMLAAGLPMMLIKKKSQRMKHKYRLLTVDKDSPFYLRELEHMKF